MSEQKVTDDQINDPRNVVGVSFRKKDGSLIYAQEHRTKQNPLGNGKISSLCEYRLYSEVIGLGQPVQEWWKESFGSDLKFSEVGIPEGKLGVEDSNGTQYYLMSNSFIFVASLTRHEVWSIRRS